MILDRDAVARLVPQQGAMFLLDGIESWDAQRIICSSMQHRSATNPLRTPAGLACVHAIEFAAQAMAAHASLTASAGATAQQGLLISARDCFFRCVRLDTIEAPLRIEAALAGGDAAGTRVYAFKVEVDAQAEPIVEGRLAVLLLDEERA